MDYWGELKLNFKAIGIVVVMAIVGGGLIGMVKLPTVPLPINMILGVLIILIGGIVGPVYWLIELKMLAPEAYIFERCRKKDLPVLLDIEIGSNKGELVPGEKDKGKGPIFTYKDDEDLKLDPAYLHNTEAINLGNGLYMYQYATSQYLPLSPKNVLGLNTCKRIARECFPELDFLNDRDLMGFIKMDRTALAENVATVLEKYDPEWSDGSKVKTEEVMNAIIELQDRCSKTPIDTHLPMALTAAFAMNPVTHQSQDLAGAWAILKKLADLDAWKKFNIMIYAMAFVMVIGVLAFAIFVLTM